MKLILQIQPTGVATTGGSWQENTLKISGGYLKEIYVKATTTTTTFDFDLVDSKDRVIYDENGNYGLLQQVEREICLKGIYTMRIANASANEPFEVYSAVDEG